ncbi:Efflux transporter, RND family, MFP subunit [Parafrankia sp. Ea1.12]|uniref:HlyD family efflux transporter periplasmic adaptor subunit n=1 Tax=Parafrankia sp. Ea1.12 TaxID=573499 RepID=UPI000DA43475|nr:HlyD family efflux transporter periplasmic adaptor subunit [Parafrankia sp. Ea1.12]SQE00088.1 Efflux transporter, RND family, MFP subunit [Parafrankia sp. Ea1.12]
MADATQRADETAPADGAPRAGGTFRAGGTSGAGGGSRPAPRRPRRPRKAVVGGVAALVLVGAGVGAGLAVTADDGPSYRLAAATTSSVTQTLTSVGTLSTVDTATLSFPVGGTVTGVPVQIGDQVSAGQVLANLDPTALQSALNTANQNLANARLTLTDDASGQTSTGGGQGATAAVASASSSAAGPSGSTIGLLANASSGSSGTGAGTFGVQLASASADGSTKPSALDTAVTTAQQEVVAAQSALDGVLTDLGADLGSLTAQGGGCAVTGGSPPEPISYTATPTPADSSARAGTIGGTVGDKDTVTLTRNGTVIATRTGPYTFRGLDTGAVYTVTIQQAGLVGTIDVTRCQSAISGLITRFGDASSASGESNLAALASRLASAKVNLDTAVAALHSAGGVPAGPEVTPSTGPQPGGTTSPVTGGTVAPSQGGSGLGSHPSTAPSTKPTVTATPRPSPSSSDGGSSRGESSGDGSSGSGSSSGSDARPTPAPSESDRAGSAGSGSGAGGGGLAGSGSGGGSGAGTAGGSGGGAMTTRAAQPATAEQLAADQAAIDAAVAQVAVAQQNLNGATLTSPISGTVAAISLAPGATVGAFSTSGTITVLGDGDKQITTTVPLSAVDTVKVSNPATVTVDGVKEPLTGTVSSIGALNSTTGSTTTYPVRIVLKPTSTRLFDGTGATVSITVKEVKDVLTVPTSAVHRVGQLATVTALKDGKATAVRVETGAVGPERTEVISGLQPGDQVVLADINADLPSGGSARSSTSGGLFGNGNGNGGGGGLLGGGGTGGGPGGGFVGGFGGGSGGAGGGAGGGGGQR